MSIYADFLVGFRRQKPSLTIEGVLHPIRSDKYRMSNLMTETELAKRLNVSLASGRRWRLERRGPAFVKVGVLVRYRPEDLAAWLSALPTGGCVRTSPRRYLEMAGG
jgi:Helix-turn-helix domain